MPYQQMNDSALRRQLLRDSCSSVFLAMVLNEMVEYGTEQSLTLVCLTLVSMFT
jgi:hypothetical protein